MMNYKMKTRNTKLINYVTEPKRLITKITHTNNKIAENID